MNKRIWLALSSCLFVGAAIAQTTVNHPYNTGIQNIVVPSGDTIFYYDSGGESYNYDGFASFYHSMVTFSPALPGQKIKVQFTSFSTEDNYDALFIYNGNEAETPDLTNASVSTSLPNQFNSGLPQGATFREGGFMGGGLPGVFVSTAPSGALTFQFQSDAAVNLSGWSAILTSECFSSGSNDIGVASIDSLSFLCPGNHPVYVTVQNFGDNQVDTFTLEWEFDGVAQPPVHWNAGVLDTCGGAGPITAPVLLGIKTLAAGGTHAVKVWTSQPNGSPDPVNSNDTLQATVAPALGGIYTLGGSSPDYPSFSAAVNAMVTQGICDTVIFNVRNGTYNEQVTIPEIPGADSLRPVIFRSESGDSSLVILTFESTGFDPNYTLRLNGADWLTFSRMTMEATGTDFGRVVEITGGANHNRFLNNRFLGVSTSSAYDHMTLVGSPYSAFNEFNVFKNNHFLNGSYGLSSWVNYNGNHARGLEVRDNIFENQYWMGISTNKQSHPIISGNLISGGVGSGFYGIEIVDVQDGLELTFNQIKGIASVGSTGISASNMNGSPSATCLIANNFVQLGGTDLTYGMNLTSDDEYHHILFNTIRISNTNPNSCAFFDNSAMDKQLKNNILSNTGGGMAISVSSGSLLSDHNNFQVTGGMLGRIGTGNYADLASWQAGTGQDGNSLAVNPLFLLPDDFHTSAIELNGAAQASPLVVSDLDGQPRNVSMPDIGADEFNPAALDASLVAFASPVLPFAPGVQDVKVTLKNNGMTTLSSATIGWKLNGASQTPVSWTGSLVSGQSDTLSLGTTTFNPGVAYDLQAFSSQPNGVADENPANDTLLLDNFYTALAGVYTIGGTSPDFADFTSAVAALHLQGVGDSVIFNVRNGAYLEQVTIHQIMGAGSARPVIFQSESGDSTQVVLSFEATSSADNYTLRLAGADWLRFHQLSIQATGSTFSRVLEIKQLANNNVVSNCRLEGPPTTSTSPSMALVFQDDYSQNEFNVFENNRLLNGSMGMSLSGFFDTRYTQGLQVKGNIFENQYIHAVQLFSFETPLISNNAITSSSVHPSYSAISVNYCLGINIIGNKLSGLDNVGAGIKIANVDGTATQPGLIANNFVQIGGSSLNTTGISTSNCSYQHFLYNTVHITNTDFSSQAVKMVGGSNNVLNNNIFACTGGGIAIQYGPPGIAASNFNDFYTSGTVLCNLDGNNLGSLYGWQNATGFDANSLALDPAFDSVGHYVVNEPVLNGYAQPSSLVAYDIEGTFRSATAPDLGVLEFSSPLNEAALLSFASPKVPFAAGTQSVQVNLRNNGASPIGSAILQWQVNGVSQPAVVWTGNLAGGATAAVSLGTYNFNLGTSYELKAWLSLPNGLADPYPANDTTILENLTSGLAGVYTIGGSSPDFANFSTAVEALHLRGVVGAVAFNVRPGNYLEQITINRIPGADSLKTVTFQSESGDSSQVVLRASGSFANNHVLRLNGTDWVNFRKMTIEQLSALFGQCITIQGGCHHVSFTSNHIKTVGPDHSGIYINDEANYRLVIRNNDFLMGYAGLYALGSASQPIQGLVVEDNLFRDQNNTGLYLYYATDPLVRGNEVRNSQYGIYVEASSAGAEITGNHIYNIALTGIVLSALAGTPADPALVANNFVQAEGTSTAFGIWVNNGSNLEIAFNSVNMTSVLPSSTAFYNAGGSAKRVQNNIFANSGGGYAYYNDTPASIDLSDHNDLYTTGYFLGFWNGFHANLADWVATTQLDSHSLSVNPAFVSATDLHTTLPDLNDAGKPIPSVLTDFDGDARDPAMPDIGADEFPISNEDAGLTAIDQPAKPFPAGLQPVLVSVFNNGLDTLETVTIHWEVNGAPQAPFNWSGSLLSGETADSVNIGSFIFSLSNSYDIRAWTSLPNGLADTINHNDTTELLDLYPALGGFYTIGGSAPDFPDFAQAVLALTLGGVVDSVVFNVRAGTYQEQLSIPEITGASLSHSIAFQSESGDSTAVILTFNNNSDPAANYTLLLDGADFLRFRRLTLQGDGNFSRLAELRNGADKNRFEYCRFLAANTNHELVYSAENSVNDNFNAFNHNYFSQGSLGIHLSGNGSKETGTVVAYNVFKDQAYTAVYLNNQSGAQVLSNEISTVQPSNFNGIYIDQCQDNIKVLKNNVGPVPLGVGIYLNNCQSSPGQEALVANNFVYVGSGNTISLGISINGGARFRIYHNNVHNASNNASTYSFYNNLGNFVEARNNVFASSGAGHAVGIIGGGSFVSDFNDLFSTGGAHLGYWEGTPAANLGEWQSASGQDMHSISADPLFASPSDLHVSETDLNRAGMPLAQVSDDFDGDPRDPVSPDIGADEFAPMAYNDAGVVDILQPNDNVPFAAGLRTVTAVVKNNGLDTINSLTVQWRVNNILQTPYSWSGTLLPGEPDTVDIGTYFFPVGLPHAILAYTQNPDGAADTTNFNDTTLVAGLWAGLGGAYTIGGSLPDFADFSAAVNALNEGGVVAAVTFNVRGGVYNEQIEVNPIKGSSLANAVAFQSESLDSADVRLTAAYGNLVSLNGADHLSFRHLTLEKTDWGHVVSISNGSNNVGFFDNHILSTDPVSSYDLINSGNSLDNSTVIARNRLRGGKTAVSLSGQGASSTYLESGTIIEDNDLSGCSQGISLSYQNAPLVQRNAVSSSSLGIELVHSRNLFRVLNNKVTVSGAGASSGYGLLIADSEGTSGNRGLVANNFVHVDGTGPSHGMYINGGVYANYHFNNVNISNTNPSSRAFFSFAGSNKQLLNNVLANSGGGYAVSADGGGGLLSADYNDLYATGPYLGSWNGTIAPDLPTYRALSGRESNSLSVNPLFFSGTDLHVLQTQLDSAAFVVTGITQDIDGQPRNATHPDIGADEIAFLPDDLGVSMLVSPASACTLSGSEAVTVKVQNYSSSPLTGFSVAYSVNGGAPVVQSAGSLSVPAGGTANFTFSTPVNMATTGLYEVSAWTVFAPDTNEVNDTLFATVNHTGAPGLVNNMIPVDGADDLPVNITFSWSPASASSKYDLYIWNASGTQPLLPTAPNITQISYFFSGSNFFSYGQTYKWRVVAKNNFCSTPGPVQQFTILNLPDFSVPEVTAPVSAFSGQSIGINWQVKNTGSGSTAMNTWIDAVFLSSDMFFDPNTDVNLGTATNFSALDVMESYSNTASFTLPNGISGNYYIFVVADYYDYLTEASENNNSKISAALPVTLTPPPDLFVPLIIPPGNAFSGSPVTINITVKNQGLGETRSGNWVDRVWLSPDPGALSTTNATLLGTRPFSGTLGVNATYTFNLTEMLPQGISGTYYIYVQTDANSEEYEQANETNNTSRSPAFNIFLTPPPDLQVTAASAPASGSNREVVTLSWTVENLGGSVAPAGWFDRVFISPNPALTDFTSAVQLGSFLSTASLQPGASYTQTKTLNLPDSITGDYYFYVLTDAYDNVFEHTFNNNNSLRVSNATAVLTPNLAVSGIQVLNAANSGDTLQLSWRVKNTGPGKLLTGSWSDRVYISTSSSYSGNPTQVGSLAATNLTLLPGDSISRSATVILPNGISGQYHLFVFTDGGLQVYENNLESNNVNQPGLSLPVTLSPYPDLVPVNFTGATAGQAGGAVPVSYVVRNMGTGAAQGLSWKDKVYLSNSSSFNPTNAALLRIEGSSQTVPKDAAYSRSFNVNLPSNLNSGTYYFFVEADQENQVYEHTQEGNNRLAGNSIAVTGYPQVDLSPTAAQGPATANSGETISVSWTVSNLAGVPTIVTGWEDGIFLSTDQQFDAGTDILLGTRQQGGPLSAGASYSASKSVSLPNGISGTYYLIVRTDRNSKNNDSNPGNNHKVGTNGVGAVQPIVISLAPSPNLAIANFTLPPQCFAGQQVEAHWTIQNIGNGGTAGQSWTDKFYLSTDLVLDNADLLVGSRVNTSSLLNGSGYTDTIELTIPVSQVGNRILILKTDANDAVYEHNGENNNTATASTLVILPPPSDLVAMNVSAPAMAAAGEEVMVTWKLKNQGANPAVGAMKEAVFFSDDNTWDVNDALLATLSDNVDLSPGETQSRSLLADLRGVEEGSYFVVVRTDILDNIFEGNNANNTSVSTYPVNVVIQKLPFDVTTPAVLDDNRELYYRIETAGLEGETMLVTLTGDSLNGNNELYLRHEMTPTRAVHDYSHDTPFSGNQQLLVPALAGGTYYLMAYGSTSAADQQSITLLAEILEFEILSVNGNQGGNNGYATIQVRGSKFDSTMSVILERFGNAVPPVSVHYVNPTLVFATFDLRNRPLGLYDVTAIKTNGETATLDDGFTIVPGSDSKLATNLIYPPNSRVNNIVPVTVEYQNTGDTDLLNPVVRLISLSGAPVAFSPDDLVLGLTELEIPLSESNAPPGLLRPGAAGNVTVYAKATAALEFLILLPDLD